MLDRFFRQGTNIGIVYALVSEKGISQPEGLQWALAFSKFYHRHSELIVKYNIGLKTLLEQGILEPIFYGDLVYKFKRIVVKPNFSDQFKKIVKRYIRVGYNLDIMRQSATQSLFIAMVSSLIARRWVRPQTL